MSILPREDLAEAQEADAEQAVDDDEVNSRSRFGTQGEDPPVIGIDAQKRLEFGDSSPESFPRLRDDDVVAQANGLSILRELFGHESSVMFFL